MELMASHPAILKASWLLTSWRDFLVIFFLDFRDWSLSDLKLEVLTLKTDSHAIIFWSFFSFLKLLAPVKIVLSMALYFQIVNNAGSAENSFLYNSKVIQLTVNGRSFPKRTLKTIYYG